MMSIDAWHPWVAILFLGGWAALAIAHFAYSLYLSRRHTEALKEALKNSRYIYLWGPSLGRRGWIWSLIEIANMMAMIMMPKTHIRLGSLARADYEHFPPYLKRRFKFNFAMEVVAGVWLALAVLLLEFG
jgi:hypothetical protein